MLLYCQKVVLRRLDLPPPPGANNFFKLKSPTRAGKPSEFSIASISASPCHWICNGYGATAWRTQVGTLCPSAQNQDMQENLEIFLCANTCWACIRTRANTGNLFEKHFSNMYLHLCPLPQYGCSGRIHTAWRKYMWHVYLHPGEHRKIFLMIFSVLVMCHWPGLYTPPPLEKKNCNGHLDLAPQH